MTGVSYAILAIGVAMKLVLYIYCSWAKTVLHSDSLAALAEDHLNDVLSNTVAIMTMTIAAQTPFWYIDPLGAILISAVIILRWMFSMSEQVEKLIGKRAPDEFIQEVGAKLCFTLHFTLRNHVCVTGVHRCIVLLFALMIPIDSFV